MSSHLRSRIVTYALVYTLWLVLLWALTGGIADGKAWFGSWAQWDTRWYEQIWLKGYPKEDPRAMVFPPGYSFIVGSLSIPFGGFHQVAMAFNVMAFFAAMVMAAEIFAAHFLVSPLGVFVFALSSPAGYFVLPSYSDAAFSLFLWGSLYCALIYPTNKWARGMEALLLLFAPWVRMTGYALAPWILLKRWAALAILASLGIWLLTNKLIAGDPFYFLEAQKLFLMPQGSILDGLQRTLHHLVSDEFPRTREMGTEYLQFQLLPIFYFLTLTLAAVWLGLRRQWLLALTVLSILMMSHNQSFWRSTVRYDWPLMPCLAALILGAFGARKAILLRGALLGVLTVIQFALQIYFAHLFKTGHWAF